MATVWSADDTVLGRRVAVKVLHHDLRRDPQQVRRFHQEAISSARLSHPGVIAIYDQITDDVDAIVMELVRGRTLREHLVSRSPMPVEEALEVAIGVCDALGEAHSQNIIHRDISPTNIIVCHDGTVKLADFGIAKSGDDTRLTATGTLLGTAAYLAPEQLEGHSVDARTDVYALGGVLYFMLTGRPPFQGATEAERANARLTRDPIPVRQLRPDVPPVVADAVARALARQPARRFPSAAELRAALVDARPSRPGLPASRNTARQPRVVPSTAPTVMRPAVRTRSPVGASPSRSSSSAPRQRGRRRGGHSWAGTAVLVGLVGGATLLLIALLGDTGRTSRETPEASKTTIGSNAAAPLTITKPTTFDPEGRGTPGENDTRVGAVNDNDLASTWATEGYRQRNFGTKSGVGLILLLSASARLERIDVRTPTEGWTASAYVVDSAAAITTLPPTAIGSATASGGSLSIDLGGRTGRQVVLWITDLGSNGPPYRVEIAEISIVGRPNG